MPSFACSLVWIPNLVSYIERKTHTESESRALRRKFGYQREGETGRLEKIA
jgi:hypothetical protein